MVKRLILIAVVLLMLSSCNGNTISTSTSPADEIPTAAPTTEVSPTPTDTQEPATDTPEPTETSAPTPTQPAAYGPANFPANVDPLTGLEVSDPALLQRRPVAVKIQMFPRGGRPPMGVSQADIVYDFYQNFGLTRFHAIFYGKNAETVGPIRSARLLDISLIDMYKSVFAFGGAENRTVSKLLSSDFSTRLVFEGANQCPPMCRIDPNAKNFLVTNTDEVSKYIAKKGVDNSKPNLNGMSFGASIPSGGQPGTQVFTRYSISSYNRWDYDANSGRYLRFQDMQEASSTDVEAYGALNDGISKTQIAADNVIVLLAAHQYAFGTHSGPSEVIDINLAGSGKAYAFREGQVFELQWNRPTKDSVLFLTFPDGTPYPFKPGNIWFEVVGKTSKIEKTAQGIYRYTMNLP